jgi:DNA-binding MarR family transcriptional regulator
MELALPSETVFHSIETSIKAYRKFAQQNISKQIKNITVDQCITLIYLAKFPELNQNQLAKLLFKDNASFTRMINTIVKNGFLKRSMNLEDRRRFNLEITSKGTEVISRISPIIVDNRTKSLNSITQNELTQLKVILNKIKDNCI